MKVIKAEDVPQNEGPQIEIPKVDEVKLAELQEKFDALKGEMDTKGYPVYLNAEETTFFFEDFYPNIEWKGYESYAVCESHDRLKDQVTESGELNGKIRPEIAEAAFHFIKNFTTKGVDRAVMFKRIADQFAICIQEINQDRQNLRDLSLEIVSVEQNIPVEDLVKAMEQAQANK